MASRASPPGSVRAVNILGPVELVVDIDGVEHRIHPAEEDKHSPFHLTRKELVCLVGIFAGSSPSWTPLQRLANEYYDVADMPLNLSGSTFKSEVSHVRAVTGVELPPFDGSTKRWKCPDDLLVETGVECDARTFVDRGLELIQQPEVEIDLTVLDEVLGLWRNPDDDLPGIGFLREHRETYTQLVARRVRRLLATATRGDRSVLERIRRDLLVLEAVDSEEAADLREALRLLRVEAPPVVIRPGGNHVNEPPTASIAERIRPQLDELSDERATRLLGIAALFVGLSQHEDGSWSDEVSHLATADGTLRPWSHLSVTSWCALGLYQALGGDYKRYLSETRTYYERFRSQLTGAYGEHADVGGDSFEPAGMAIVPHFRHTASAAKFLLVVDGPSREVATSLKFLVDYGKGGGWPERTTAGSQIRSVLATTYVLDTLEKATPRVQTLGRITNTGLDDHAPDGSLERDLPLCKARAHDWLARVQVVGGWRAHTGGTPDLSAEDLTAHVVGFLPQFFKLYPGDAVARTESMIRNVLLDPAAGRHPLSRTALYAFGASRIDVDRFRKEIEAGVRTCLDGVEEATVGGSRPRLLDMTFVLLLAQMTDTGSGSPWSERILDYLDAMKSIPRDDWEQRVPQDVATIMRAWLP